MKRFNVLLIAALLLLPLNLFSQDASGTKDVPYLTRFNGSKIIWQEAKNFDRYYLLSLKDDKLNPYEIEGKILRTQYQAGEEHSVFEIYKSYEQALKNDSYKILITLDEKNCGVNLQEQLYNSEFNGLNSLPKAAEKPDYKENFAYFVATKKINGKQVYIVGFITKWKIPMITLDIIEVQAMDAGLVTPKKINESIDAEGHIAIYDIHFDTGSSNIKPESADALKNIAEYLNNHKDKKYLVVGHTDNTGSFETNLKLSEERANAVMSELTGKYGVNPAQLKAFGAGQAAPVATNANEDGKKLNRRVEIVIM